MTSDQVGVFVVERNASLRETLQTLLEDAGYGVVACADGNLAVKLLQIAPHPFVVVLSHRDENHDFRQVLAAIQTLPAHAYILLSSRPARAPWQWNPYTQRFVPVVPVPCDVDTFLAQVAGTVNELLPLLPARPLASAHPLAG